MNLAPAEGERGAGGISVRHSPPNPPHFKFMLTPMGTNTEHFVAIIRNGGYDADNHKSYHVRLGGRISQINRGFFFTHVRRIMFSNVLQQSQVDGINAILDAWEEKYAERR